MSDSSSDEDGAFTFSTPVVFKKKKSRTLQESSSEDERSDSSDDEEDLKGNGKKSSVKRKKKGTKVSSLLDSDDSSTSSSETTPTKRPKISATSDNPQTLSSSASHHPHNTRLSSGGGSGGNPPQDVIAIDLSPSPVSEKAQQNKGKGEDSISVDYEEGNSGMASGVLDDSMGFDSSFVSENLECNDALNAARAARARLQKAQNEVVDLAESEEEVEEEVVEVVENKEVEEEKEETVIKYGGGAVELKIRINGDSKNILSYPTTMLTPFKVMVSWLSVKYGVEEGRVRVKLDGDVVGGMGTPDGEDLEDGDILEAEMNLGVCDSTVAANKAACKEGGGEKKGEPVIVSVRRNDNKRQCKKFKVLSTDPISKIRKGFMSHYKKGKVQVVVWLRGRALEDDDTLVGAGWNGDILDGMDNGKSPKGL